MMIDTTMVLAGVAAAQLVTILALLWMLHRTRVDGTRSVDRLLLLGKSSTPGEAIAAYERLNRMEEARAALLDQVKLAKIPGADSVAQKGPRVPNWFGIVGRKKPTQPIGG